MFVSQKNGLVAIYLVPSLFPSVNFEPLPRTNYALDFLVIKLSTVTVYPAAAALRQHVFYYLMAMTHVRYSPAIKILLRLDSLKPPEDKIAAQMATNQNSVTGYFGPSQRQYLVFEIWMNGLGLLVT